MAFCWRDDGGPSLNADLVALWFYIGSRPVLLKYPIFLLFLGVGGPDPLPLSGSAHAVDGIFHWQIL